jgi:hypothetical protein
MIFMETAAVHMHVGVVGIFEAGPLATPDGGVDIERIRSHIDGVLDELPRFRQRLAFIPLEDHPVWVDDDRFHLSDHLHHECLPRPGQARFWPADLVVMGRSDRHGPSSPYLGGVTEHVLEFANCPVLVVPQTPPREAGPS